MTHVCDDNIISVRLDHEFKLLFETKDAYLHQNTAKIFYNNETMHNRSSKTKSRYTPIILETRKPEQTPLGGTYADESHTNDVHDTCITKSHSK